jgi:hypothetical protein
MNMNHCVLLKEEIFFFKYRAILVTSQGRLCSVEFVKLVSQ